MAGNPDGQEREGEELMVSLIDIVRELHTFAMPDDDRILLAEDRITWQSTPHVGHDQRTAIDAWLIATAPPVARRLWWFSEMAVSAWRNMHAANRA